MENPLRQPTELAPARLSETNASGASAATPDEWPGVSMPRLLAMTLAITGLYLLLQYVFLATGPAVAGVMGARAEAEWPSEAAAVAEASRARDAAAPAEWRAAAFRIGFDLGYAGHVLGGYALASADIQARAREIVGPQLASAQTLATALELGEVGPLPVSTLDDFVREDERIEADELGIGERLEQRASRRHRHLFLLGMHVGVATAAVQTTPESYLPKRWLIGRHATLAGVPTNAWEPLASAPPGRTADERLAAFRSSLDALESAVGHLAPLP